MASNLTVSILLKLVDAVSGPASHVSKAIKDAGKEFAAFQKRSDAAFKKAANLNQSAEALRHFNAQLMHLAEAPIEAASDFETNLARLRIEAGVSGKEIDGLGASIQRMATGTEFSSTEVAQAFLELDDAGLSVAESSAQVGKVMTFATGASLSLRDAAQLTGSVLKSFQRPAGEAGKVTDVVSAAANLAGVNVADFGRALAGVGDKARAVGVGVESAAAVMTLFAKSGLSAGEAASTTQTMITRLGSPRNVKATKQIFDALKVKPTDASGNLKDLPTLLEEIGKATAGLSNVTRQRVFEKLFGREAAASANALFQAIKPEEFTKLRKELSATEGTAERNAEIMEKTAKVNREKLHKAFENLSTVVGAKLLPHLTHFLELASKGVDRVTAFADAHPGLTKAVGTAFAGLVAVTGALSVFVSVLAAARTVQGVFLLARGFLGLGQAVAGVVANAGPLAGVFGTIKAGAAAIAPAAGVFGAVALAIGAVGLALFELQKHWDELDVFEGLKGIKDTYLEGLKGGDFLGFSVIGQALDPRTLLKDIGVMGGPDAGLPSQQRVGVDMNVTIDSQGRPSVKDVSTTGGGLNLATDVGMSMVTP